MRGNPAQGPPERFISVHPGSSPAVVVLAHLPEKIEEKETGLARPGLDSQGSAAIETMIPVTDRGQFRPSTQGSMHRQAEDRSGPGNRFLEDDKRLGPLHLISFDRPPAGTGRESERRSEAFLGKLDGPRPQNVTRQQPESPKILAGILSRNQSVEIAEMIG
jgi:hypothetical protein